MNINFLFQKYEEIFDITKMPTTYFAPGRINLIGEHTDYNGGHVFPAAISFGTYALVTEREDSRLRFYSLNFSEKGMIECTLDDLHYDMKHDWANYPKGMIQLIKESGYDIKNGLDILFYGTIPNGAGLSSSASIEMVTGILLKDLYGLSLDQIEIIQLGQKVENDYIGVNSGIMDQFAIGKGKKDHAILLDCQTLQYQYAPLNLTEHVIVIMNTNKTRTLAHSKYNERRAQCIAALNDLQSVLPINSLGELSIEEFEAYAHLIQNPIHRKRAKHAVYENVRTLQAFDYLQQGCLEQFGALMNESHFSLQTDYEVTGIELDTLVGAAMEQPGVVGARMTGAGFGGCAIAIVNKKNVATFISHVNKSYRNAIGYEASFHIPTIVTGAGKLKKVGV